MATMIDPGDRVRTPVCTLHSGTHRVLRLRDDGKVVIDNRGVPEVWHAESLTMIRRCDRLRVYRDATLAPEFPWCWSLRDKDGVYGSLATQEEALAVGLAEWRQTYPEDWT